LRREQELNDLQQRFQQSYQDNQLALEKASQEKMAMIYQKVNAAVKKLAEAGNYVYVVDLSVGAISFVNTTISTDITTQLQKELGVTVSATTTTAPTTPAK
jgi:outer membrane protein